MRKWLISALGSLVALVGLFLLSTEQVQAIVLQGSFIDDNQSVHQNGIEALAAAGITQGCNPPANSRFCPDSDVTRAEAATFLARALNLTGDGKDYFVDDDGHVLEAGINRLAAAGITQGCNPPVNTRFCPDRSLTRAEFAAFVARGLGLGPTSKDYFVDDDGNVLEAAINRIAEAGITVGCNPPANDRFCPSRLLTRGEVATLLTRALHLTHQPQRLPLSNWSPITCDKSGIHCSLLIDTFEHRAHLVDEGFFQSLPYETGEESQFKSANTTFRLTLDGKEVAITQLPLTSTSTTAERHWQATITFTPGNHVLIGEWRWNGQLMQRTTATVRVD